jgi:hypothetical protein
MSQPAAHTNPQPAFPPDAPHGESQTPEEKAEEARRIRRLQLMMNMVMQVILQDRSLPVEQASEMVADARRAALAMFPDKALAFDLIFWPRLQRLMRERYRMQ